jgi:predicted AAA+ superfamily ATPase
MRDFRREITSPADYRQRRPLARLEPNALLWQTTQRRFWKTRPMSNSPPPGAAPKHNQKAGALLARIADALERLAPPPPPAPDFGAADAFVWHADAGRLAPVARVNRVDMALLRGIDLVRDSLAENTERFAKGLPANNALLWGARGMGKSSLVKAVHAEINARAADGPKLKLVEIHREDIESLPALMSLLRDAPMRFLVFCDDLSFDGNDASYKSLKAVLEGGIEGRPANVLFYATSNRRHLLPRDMMENERSTAINPGEAVEEKVSLSDRFGLWLGFHRCSQDEYLAMVFGYADHFGLKAPHDEVQRDALEWATTRGSRSGRTAWQFIQDLAGRLGRRIDA